MLRGGEGDISIIEELDRKRRLHSIDSKSITIKVLMFLSYGCNVVSS